MVAPLDREHRAGDVVNQVLDRTRPGVRVCSSVSAQPEMRRRHVRDIWRAAPEVGRAIGLADAAMLATVSASTNTCGAIEARPATGRADAAAGGDRSSRRSGQRAEDARYGTGRGARAGRLEPLRRRSVPSAPPAAGRLSIAKTRVDECAAPNAPQFFRKRAPDRNRAQSSCRRREEGLDRITGESCSYSICRPAMSTGHPRRCSRCIGVALCSTRAESRTRMRCGPGQSWSAPREPRHRRRRHTPRCRCISSGSAFSSAGPPRTPSRP